MRTQPEHHAIRNPLRALGRAVPAVRSGWYLALELRSMAGATPARQQRKFEALFAARADPWGYGEDGQGYRFRRELDMLLQARGPEKFRSALEIGCAEGAFTEMLAPHCESLIAADFSATALAHARLRSNWPAKVRFRKMDLLSDPLPESLDLIVAIDVLDDLAKPWRIRTIRQKLVTALAAGGMLVVGNPRANRVIENSRWGRLLVRGGTWIGDFFSRHPSLERVAELRTDWRIDSVFRLRQGVRTPVPAPHPQSAPVSMVRRLPLLRSLYHQLRILGSIFRHRFLVDQVRDCDLSHLRRDWDFTAAPERLRYARVMSAIEAARQSGHWGTVLEIGCSGGIFTSKLAARCDRVIAVDLSPVACKRAAERCAKLGNVAVRQGNIRDAWPENSYDVIVAMCVWEYLQGRDQNSAVARRMTAALQPGGILVVNATRLPTPYENSWWARWLVVGGVQISRFLAKQENLVQLSSACFPDYTIAVFEKAKRPHHAKGALTVPARISISAH